jgi:hypothetical protein
MPQPMPVPPFVHRLPADVAARIRATAPPATGPRRMSAFVVAVAVLGGALAAALRVEDRYLC